MNRLESHMNYRVNKDTFMSEWNFINDFNGKLSSFWWDNKHKLELSPQFGGFEGCTVYSQAIKVELSQNKTLD